MINFKDQTGKLQVRVVECSNQPHKLQIWQDGVPYHHSCKCKSLREIADYLDAFLPHRYWDMEGQERIELWKKWN